MTSVIEDVVTSDAGAPVPLAPVGEPDAIRVLLIEDDAIDRGFLANELSRQGFAVRKLASLPGASNAARDADVIVLHCDPVKNFGIGLLVELHRQGVDIPVVVLTDRAPPAPESLALDKRSISATDKPRGAEVLARRFKGIVKAFGRADQSRAGWGMAVTGPAMTQAQPMICGKLLLRPDVSRAHWKDADLDLSLGEYNIVELLASKVGRYVTYRAIYDRLHYEGFIAGSGTDGYRGNVRTAIKRIRNKFRGLDPTFDEIENYSGFGYCWKKPD